MSTYKSAFFAFPGEPAELKDPIIAAVDLVKSNPSLTLQAWPQLPIFGAAIPDEVKGGIQKANVLVCDITKANLNVYYEIGYGVGLGKSLAPVLNVSFANATADIQKDGLFDIIGYKAYENSRGLAEILLDLPSAVLVDLYGISSGDIVTSSRCHLTVTTRHICDGRKGVDARNSLFQRQFLEERQRQYLQQRMQGRVRSGPRLRRSGVTASPSTQSDCYDRCRSRHHCLR